MSTVTVVGIGRHDELRDISICFENFGFCRLESVTCSDPNHRTAREIVERLNVTMSLLVASRDGEYDLDRVYDVASEIREGKFDFLLDRNTPPVSIAFMLVDLGSSGSRRSHSVQHPRFFRMSMETLLWALQLVRS